MELRWALSYRSLSGVCLLRMLSLPRAELNLMVRPEIAHA